MTETVVRSLHDPYTFRNHEHLVECLEQYCTIRGRPKCAKIGEGAGEDEPLGNRYDAIIRQNGAIDRCMGELRSRHTLSYRLLDAYYRKGLHEENNGWERSLLSAKLPHHPQTYRERILLETFFGELLTEATDALLRAHVGRSRRED
jgi:hypothetical protein